MKLLFPMAAAMLCVAGTPAVAQQAGNLAEAAE